MFLAALRPLRLPASQGEVRAYLLATSRTVLARYWARTFGHQVTSLPGDVGEVFTGTPLESEAPQRAERILAALPERYRRILQLRFLDACLPGPARRGRPRAVARPGKRQPVRPAPGTVPGSGPGGRDGPGGPRSLLPAYPCRLARARPSRAFRRLLC